MIDIELDFFELADVNAEAESNYKHTINQNFMNLLLIIINPVNNKTLAVQGL